jgi:hypothetical protein
MTHDPDLLVAAVLGDDRVDVTEQHGSVDVCLGRLGGTEAREVGRHDRDVVTQTVGESSPVSA